MILSSSTTTRTQAQAQSQAQQQQRDKNLEKLKQVVYLIQNPELYSTSWADYIEINIINTQNKENAAASANNLVHRAVVVVASSNVMKGQIIGLHPIQDITFQRRQRQRHQQQDPLLSSVELPAVCVEVDLLEEIKYPYPCIRRLRRESTTKEEEDDRNSNRSEKKEVLYIHSDDQLHPGWYGNLIPILTAADDDKKNETTISKIPSASPATTTATAIAGNCIIVPLPGAAPLCAIVATQDIAKGDPINRQEVVLEENGKEHQYSSSTDNDNDDDENEMSYYIEDIAEEYAHEIGELVSFLDMACDASNYFSYLSSSLLSSSLSSSPSSSSQSSLPLPSSSLMLFHQINTSYPNITKMYSSPDIYSIPDFLSQSECERIIQKASCNMQPCLIKNEISGTVEPDSTRTSWNANIPQKEVPTLIQKIINLMNTNNNNNNDRRVITKEQIEIVQVLRYRHGQEFQSHTDGYNGPTTACGFYQSGRIATIFCYLNDVKEDGGGGKTSFPLLSSGSHSGSGSDEDDQRSSSSSSLDVTPKRGLAIVHFPTSVDLKEDERTEHIGNPVTGDTEEKWILTIWVWKNQRADQRYSEDALPSLSNDII